MIKKNSQEINAGSMADIAFLLLIFFLVTTTIETDLGIIRKLPPDINIIPPVVPDRNVLTVLVNRNNELLVEQKRVQISELREVTKEFIENIKSDNKLPTLMEEEFDYIGKMLVTSKHVISLRSDRGTSYETYIAVQNELVAAYQELREELTQKKWGVSYADLNKEYRKVIDEVYSVKISEAEPIHLASK
jgi:biopolymer transport protein ExbD